MERPKRKRTTGLVVLGLVPLLGLGLAQVAGGSSSGNVQSSAQKAIPFDDARLKIEFNATDGDAGLQIFVDAEPWRTVTITDPRGREVARFKSEDVIKDFGLTELFSESSEPPFDEFPFEQFKQLFPEGRYTFSGTTIDGQQLKSVFRFTHKVPDAPNIVTPADESDVAPDQLVVSWDSVTSPDGVKVVAYQVLVVADEPAQGNPVRVLDVMLPADATRLPIPAEFLQPGGYKTEVLAIENGGNQTLTEVAFTVR